MESAHISDSQVYNGTAGDSERALSPERIKYTKSASEKFNLTTCGGQKRSCVVPAPASSSAAVHLPPAPEPCFLWPARSLHVDASPEHISNRVNV